MPGRFKLSVLILLILLSPAIAFMAEAQLAPAEAGAETPAEEEWTAHVAEIHEQTLMAQGDKVHSWMMGANLENRKPRVLVYYGGANVYYDKLQESADHGFPEVKFKRRAA